MVFRVAFPAPGTLTERVPSRRYLIGKRRECGETEMCSIRIQTSVRWVAPALLAVTLMCSLTAQAEPTGVAAATAAASDSRDVQAELGLSPRSAQAEVSGYAG